MKLSNLRKITIIMAVFTLNSYVFGAVSVTPSKIEGRMPVGKHYEDVFKVVNTEDKPTSVAISWEDRTIKPINKEWFKLDKKTVEIPVGGTVEVKYTIDIPQNAKGEYNAWIIFTGGSLGKIYGADLTTRLSIPLYIAVSGTQKYDFDIHKIKISNSTSKGTTFYINVVNTGNVHIRPIGSIAITALDSNNPEKYTIPFNDIKWGIIPNESMEYMASFPKTSNADIKKVLPDGKYSANIKIEVKDAQFSEKDNADIEVSQKLWESDVVFSVNGAKTEIIEQKVKKQSESVINEKDNSETDNK